MGNQDSSIVKWENLNEIKNCIFFTRDNVPKNIKNLFLINNSFEYRDLIASSDVVCTKAGYSTLATSFLADIPIFSNDRKNFAEIKAVKKYIKDNQVGITLNNEAFLSCDWKETIKKTLALSVKGKVLLNGEKTVISIINDWLEI